MFKQFAEIVDMHTSSLSSMQIGVVICNKEARSRPFLIVVGLSVKDLLAAST